MHRGLFQGLEVGDHVPQIARRQDAGHGRHGGQELGAALNVGYLDQRAIAGGILDRHEAGGLFLDDAGDHLAVLQGESDQPETVGDLCLRIDERLEHRPAVEALG